MKKRKNDPEFDRKLHDRLRRAHAEGRIVLFVNGEGLNAPDAPTYNEWDNLVPLLGLMLAGLGVLLAYGIVPGLASLTVGVLLYLFPVQMWIVSRVKSRTVSMMFENAFKWDYLWKIGGMALALAHKQEANIVAPDGDWRRFVEVYLPDETEHSMMQGGEENGAATPPPTKSADLAPSRAPAGADSAPPPAVAPEPVPAPEPEPAVAAEAEKQNAGA